MSEVTDGPQYDVDFDPEDGMFHNHVLKTYVRGYIRSRQQSLRQRLRFMKDRIDDGVWEMDVSTRSMDGLADLMRKLSNDMTHHLEHDLRNGQIPPDDYQAMKLKQMWIEVVELWKEYSKEEGVKEKNMLNTIKQRVEDMDSTLDTLWKEFDEYRERQEGVRKSVPELQKDLDYYKKSLQQLDDLGPQLQEIVERAYYVMNTTGLISKFRGRREFGYGGKKKLRDMEASCRRLKDGLERYIRRVKVMSDIAKGGTIIRDIITGFNDKMEKYRNGSVESIATARNILLARVKDNEACITILHDDLRRYAETDTWPYEAMEERELLNREVECLTSSWREMEKKVQLLGKERRDLNDLQIHGLPEFDDRIVEVIPRSRIRMFGDNPMPRAEGDSQE